MVVWTYKNWNTPNLLIHFAILQYLCSILTMIEKIIYLLNKNHWTTITLSVEILKEGKLYVYWHMLPFFMHYHFHMITFSSVHMLPFLYDYHFHMSQSQLSNQLFNVIRLDYLLYPIRSKTNCLCVEWRIIEH